MLGGFLERSYSEPLAMNALLEGHKDNGGISPRIHALFAKLYLKGRSSFKIFPGTI